MEGATTKMGSMKPVPLPFLHLGCLLCVVEYSGGHFGTILPQHWQTR